MNNKELKWTAYIELSNGSKIKDKFKARQGTVDALVQMFKESWRENTTTGHLVLASRYYKASEIIAIKFERRYF